jgi:uncharacterized protein YjbI with pentapeptide repeats
MSEQQSEPTTTTATTATESTPSDAWGQSITPERQAELQGYLDRWQAETDHGERKGPLDFDAVQLTGADVHWLAEQSGRDELGDLPNLHLEGANLSHTHLEGADLRGAHLEGAGLTWAYLEGADLRYAWLQSAFFNHAHLTGAELDRAHLEYAFLFEANLASANLHHAHLEGVELDWAHLEGARLGAAHLEGARLIGAWLDSKTILSNAILDQYTRLRDIQWSGVGAVNLTQIDWNRVRTLGDEQGLTRHTVLAAHEAAVRAYRQLSAQLRVQGLNEVADRFTYRAQVLQREVYRRQRKIGAYLFSLLIAALAGYGYRLGRILVAYALIVSVFAAGFFFTGHVLSSPTLTGQSLVQGVLDAFQISLNAIHGRVFFAQFGLDTAQSWLATAESIVGIVIEGVFVATLIQRFFGR